MSEVRPGRSYQRRALTAASSWDKSRCNFGTERKMVIRRSKAQQNYHQTPRLWIRTGRPRRVALTRQASESLSVQRRTPATPSPANFSSPSHAIFITAWMHQGHFYRNKGLKNRSAQRGTQCLPRTLSVAK